MKSQSLFSISLLATVLILLPVPSWATVEGDRQAKLDNMLIEATGSFRVGQMRQLLKEGASPNARYSYFSPLSVLEWTLKRLEPPVEPVQDPRPTVLLLYLTNTRPGHLRKVPHRTDFPQLVKVLLDAGADPNVRGKDGITPLMLAAGQGFTQSMVLLLQFGADAKATDDQGWTALHHEVRNYDRYETFGVSIPYDTYFLIPLGTNINARDKSGRTPLDLTHSQFVREFLRKAGAKTGKELDAQAVNALKHGR